MRIRRIYIKNYIIIDSVEIEPERGFNVFTGETGAGKSIVIGALGIISGKRTNSAIIRKGKEECEIEVVFDGEPPEDVLKELSQGGIKYDGELIVRRRISHNLSHTYMNEKSVTLGFLSTTVRRFLEITSQFGNFYLKDSSNHIYFLDDFAGTAELRRNYEATFSRYMDVLKRIKDIEAGERERERKKDMLKHEIEEIERSCLKEDEEKELMEKREYLKNIEKIVEGSRSAYRDLYGGENNAYTLISGAIKEVEKIEKFSPELHSVKEGLESLRENLKECALILARLSEQESHDSSSIDEVEERLALISKLKRKYGSSIPEILLYLKKAKEELSKLESLEFDLSHLLKEKKELEEMVLKMAGELHKRRTESSSELEKRVKKELAELGIKSPVFIVKIEDVLEGNPENFTRTGADTVNFLFAANPDVPPQVLGKVASGGELSRLLLSLKRASRGRESSILVFDEIDVGIGGKAADSVARKIKEISSESQVFLVTHRAEVAVYADEHFLVKKSIRGQKTTVEVNPLKGIEREKEIARLLSGEETGVALEHARQLLKRAESLKM